MYPFRKDMRINAITLATAVIIFVRIDAAEEPPIVAAAKPIVGTAEGGHTFPGACVPFGMVQVSPDNRPGGKDGSAGYHHSEQHIIGFSHTHLSGTGTGDLGDVLLVPGTGVAKAPVSKPGQGLRFTHDQEIARPGYYRVFFPDQQITAELTATERCGMHRYTFPPTEQAHVVVDLRHGIGNWTDAGELTAENDHVICGSRRSTGFAGTRTFYFVAEFSKPFRQVALNVNGTSVTDQSATGKLIWASVNFGATGGEAIVTKVGLSAVSLAGARANLKAELHSFDFDAVTAAAQNAWQQQLSRVEAVFSSPADRETFYTALYHAQICPNLFCDRDEAFYGPDGKIHPCEGFSFYTSFSTWDTFRAENALLCVLCPERMADMAKSLLAHYRLSGQHHFPCEVFVGQETRSMIGHHAIPIIAEIYAKGIRDFDTHAMLDAMLDTMNQNTDGLDQYRSLGYIMHGTYKKPAGWRKPKDVPDSVTAHNERAKEIQCVSRTQEYAYDDACVVRFAAMLGRAVDATANANRANNWKNVFDPVTGFMRGRAADGKFIEPFDPRLVTFDDYAEGNAWQYAFMVPHNIPALLQAMGGDQVTIDKLEVLFNAPSDLPVAECDVVGLIGQYAHGNEPCHHVAYLFNYAGAPWHTQKCVRRIVSTLYNNTAAGLCGNDECGQMSAWYVWSALGLYPVDPSSGIYVIGSPLVTSATIHLDPRYCRGKTFTVTAINNSKDNIYVQSAQLNGEPLLRSWISHAELAAGGELILEMGAQPNTTWGADPKNRPPAALP